jgi:hypothetical protein
MAAKKKLKKLKKSKKLEGNKPLIAFPKFTS